MNYVSVRCCLLTSSSKFALGFRQALPLQAMLISELRFCNTFTFSLHTFTFATMLVTFMRITFILQNAISKITAYINQLYRRSSESRVSTK